jgi:ankyrin repeat protein
VQILTQHQQSATVANCLHENGADLEKMSSSGMLPLHHACGNGLQEVVKAILARGAHRQILCKDSTGATPLSLAIKHMREELAMFLLQELLVQPGFDINHPRMVLKHPLLCSAATVGQCRLVKMALDRGAYINAAGPDGTALSLAAVMGQLEAVKLLCERGADINAQSPNRGTSLAYAASEGHLAIVKKLIKHGADLNASSAQQLHAVLHAAMKGHSKVVTELLQAGAELNASLQFLCFTCPCKVLSDAAAAQVAAALLPHCSSSSLNANDRAPAALPYALSQGKLQVAQLLHAAGADVHCAVEEGTAVHCAVESGSLAAVEWVQSFGVDPRAGNDDGMLPLHRACSYKHANIVKHLLDLPGAPDDIHAQCHMGLTPLHLAAASAAAPRARSAHRCPP